MFLMFWAGRSSHANSFADQNTFHEAVVWWSSLATGVLHMWIRLGSCDGVIQSCPLKNSTQVGRTTSKAMNLQSESNAIYQKNIGIQHMVTVFLDAIFFNKFFFKYKHSKPRNIEIAQASRRWGAHLACTGAELGRKHEFLGLKQKNMELLYGLTWSYMD